LGLDIVGKACLVLGPASLLARGLGTGRFSWIGSDRQLRRESSTGWFWLAAATLALIAAGALFYFLEEVL
jgi:hypothetical protein